MLNLDETLYLTDSYTKQKDFYLKSFLYSFGVLIFVDILRNQVSEVNLLQLIPGFYLILLFFSFLFLVINSDFISGFSKDLDNKKEFGTKTLNKIDLFVLNRFSFFFLSIILLFVLNSVIPLSLDSFNSYGEKTLENIWSFDEVLSLEIILLIILIALYQVPILIVTYVSTEKDSQILPEYWKSLSLIIFLISGFLTPTIDGYTQLSFSFSAISLYFILINLIQKRVNVRFNGLNGIIF
jgi:Sec-independent protein secretion pathway component TatC